MISITTPTFDLDGARVFNRDNLSSISALERRVSRTKTLDGGVNLYDSGYSAGDRTIELIQRLSSVSDYDFCDRIVKLYNEIIVSTRAGTFYANPSSLDPATDGSLKLTMLVIKEIQ